MSQVPLHGTASAEYMIEIIAGIFNVRAATLTDKYLAK